MQHNTFDGEFSFNRMSWIKTNFLWMMYRSGWGTKPNQEITLAIWLKRTAFDAILSEAVHSSFVPDSYADQETWRQAVQSSDVRLQWDPDHDPYGAKQTRRAIQLGMRGETLVRFAREWIVHIEDISAFVSEQYAHVKTGDHTTLITPREAVYPVADPVVARRLGITD